MGNIGFGELLVILVIILVLFGAKRLPEIGKALGDGIREFKKAAQGLQDDEKGDEEKKEKK